MANNVPKALNRRPDMQVEAVTQHQYNTAWQLYAAGTPRSEICKLVGITVPQFQWLHSVGDGKEMLSFLAREKLEDAILREKEKKAVAAFADLLEDQVKDLLRSSTTSLKMAETIKAHFFEYKIKPAMERLRETGDAAYLDEMEFSKQLDATIKTLTKNAVQSALAAGDMINKLTKATTKEQVLPEMFGAPNAVARPAALQEQVELAAQEGAQVVASLLPEGLETEEQIAHFLANHRMPVDEEPEPEAE